MLVELLAPAGPDLARRWLAALLAVPREQRDQLVADVERRVAAALDRARPAPGDEFDLPAALPPSTQLDVVHPPVQREGYVEQVITTYAKPLPQPLVEPKPDATRRAR